MKWLYCVESGCSNGSRGLKMATVDSVVLQRSFCSIFSRRWLHSRMSSCVSTSRLTWRLASPTTVPFL